MKTIIIPASANNGIPTENSGTYFCTNYPLTCKYFVKIPFPGAILKPCPKCGSRIFFRR